MRNSSSLDEGKIPQGLIVSFKSFFSFSLLSREGSSEKGTKEGK